MSGCHCSWFGATGLQRVVVRVSWDVQVRELSAEERDQQAQIRLRKHTQIFQHISLVFAAFWSRNF